jgi:hypothetical protein
VAQWDDRAGSTEGEASVQAKRSWIAVAVGLVGLAVPASASAATTIFSNPAPITINDSPSVATPGPATPYPSSIGVSGLARPVQEVEATLHNLNHPCLYDVDFLLVGPSGAKTILLSDGGTGQCQGDPAASNVTITFDDEAASAYPCGSNPGGTFQPADDPPNLPGRFCIANPDPFPPPAPAGPYPVSLSVFDGSDPNGEWSLFIIDDTFAAGPGSLAAGWSLTLTTPNPPETTITDGPKNVVKTKKKSAKVTFTFVSSEPGTFECSLDGTPFAPCSSPSTHKVKAGRRKPKEHTFQVRAIDAAGNPDPTPAADDFKAKRKRKRKK